MYEVILSPEAEDDLVEIYRYIAEAGFPANAERFTIKIWTFCQKFNTFPNRGAARNDVAPGLRTIGFNKQVTIIFEVLEEQQQVNVLRVIQRLRDVEKALKHVR